MSDIVAQITGVFTEFEDASRNEDWARFESLFLSTFLSMDPTTVAPVEVQQLIAFLPRRRGVFESAGATGTKLATMEVSELDQIHALARTTWSVVYDEPHDPVTLRSTFLLRSVDGAWRIAVYLNHESLTDLLT